MVSGADSSSSLKGKITHGVAGQVARAGLYGGMSTSIQATRSSVPPSYSACHSFAESACPPAAAVQSISPRMLRRAVNRSIVHWSCVICGLRSPEALIQTRLDANDMRAAANLAGDCGRVSRINRSGVWSKEYYGRGNRQSDPP